MRNFNPDRELNKIKYRKRNKIVLLCFLMIVVSLISYSFALYQVRHSKRIIYTTVDDFKNNIDIILTVLVDGKEDNKFPEKGKGYYYDHIKCDIDSEGYTIANWDNYNWSLTIDTKGPNKCDVYFKYTDEYRDQSGANPPELYQGLIPVTIEDDGTIKVADITKEWYDYDKHEWANAVVLDNNVFVDDLSGNERSATVVGDAHINSDGLVLDGNDDGIYLGSNIKDLFKNSNTIQIKLKREDLNDRSIIMGNWQDNVNYFWINYEINISNQHNIFLNNMQTYVGGNFTSNDFITLSYVYDKENNQLRVYNDSTLSYTIPNINTIFNGAEYNNVYIGRDIRYDSRSLKGIIEKVMIYDKALSEENIKYNIDAKSGKVGDDGILKDNLYLYYDFKVPSKINLNLSAGDVLKLEFISQMYVWIPRYKYQLFNAISENMSNERMINIKFEKENSSTGETVCSITKSGEENCTNLLNGNWYTHPAFTFGNTELKGIWVGKFNTSGTLDLPTIKPNISSIGSVKIEPMFTAARNIETITNYGFDKNEIDTHMMKNMEWGAVAYLTQSKYGRCTNGVCEEVTYNLNSNFISGYANSSDPWNTVKGITASTTKNVYGIYDMSGGRWVVTTGTGVNSDGTILNNIFSGNSIPNLKYFDLYNLTTKGHLGDAVKETLKNTGDNGSWYSDNSTYINASSPWFVRGSSYTNNVWQGAGGGIFSYLNTQDYPYKTNTFTVVLTLQDGET